MKIKDNKMIKISDKGIKDEIIRIEKYFWVDRFSLIFGFIFLIISGFNPILLPRELILLSSICMFLIISGMIGISSGVNKQGILVNRLEIRGNK